MDKEIITLKDVNKYGVSDDIAWVVKNVKY